MNKCIAAIEERDAQRLESSAFNIEGRSGRICHVVEAEMDDYEACPYRDDALNAVHILRNHGN